MLTLDRAKKGDWQMAHEALVQLAASRAGLDFEEGQRLRTALHTGAHRRLGYGSFVEYIERLFGYSPRLTYEKLRVAEALEQLGELAAELRAGRLSWSVVRELTRVATPETEQEWLTCAAGLTVRQVEQRVSGHRPGSRPDEQTTETARRHVLRFEVSGEAFAAFSEALAHIRRDAGGPLDDDTALLLLARQALGGPADGRASYQLAVTVCEECKKASHDGPGDPVPIGAAALAMAECDGQHIGSVHATSSSPQCPRGQHQTRKPNHPTRNPSSRFTSRPTLLRISRLPPHHVRRRSPHPQQSRRRRQHSRKPHHVVRRAPPRGPPRRRRSRRHGAADAQLHSQRRHGLRRKRQAHHRRNPSQRVSRPKKHGLRRGRRSQSARSGSERFQPGTKPGVLATPRAVGPHEPTRNQSRLANRSLPLASRRARRV